MGPSLLILEIMTTKMELQALWGARVCVTIKTCIFLANIFLNNYGL